MIKTRRHSVGRINIYPKFLDSRGGIHLCIEYIIGSKIYSPYSTVCVVTGACGHSGPARGPRRARRYVKYLAEEKCATSIIFHVCVSHPGCHLSRSSDFAKNLARVQGVFDRNRDTRIESDEQTCRLPTGTADESRREIRASTAIDRSPVGHFLFLIAWTLNLRPDPAGYM